MALPFSNPAHRLGAQHQVPGETRGLEVSKHEQVPGRDWQAPGRMVQAMAAPQAASVVSSCNPHAKERRRHQIKGQRTPRVGIRQAGWAVPASTLTAKGRAAVQCSPQSPLPQAQKRRLGAASALSIPRNPGDSVALDRTHPPANCSESR